MENPFPFNQAWTTKFKFYSQKFFLPVQILHLFLIPSMVAGIRSFGDRLDRTATAFLANSATVKNSASSGLSLTIHHPIYKKQAFDCPPSNRKND